MASGSMSPDWKPTGQLYAIIVGPGIANLLAAMENTVNAVAAPVILAELKLGIDFVWITHAFFLSSGICGGASTGGMLIAGRAIQGTGSGDITLVLSIIISDLIPLRQRGSFSAIPMAIFAVGSGLGPFIGGAIVSSTTWRWVFYMNLPIGIVAFAWLFVCLQVKYNKEMTVLEKLRRLDLVGTPSSLPVPWPCFTS
ncbi:hypothetical protein QQS21_007186 [Conoideocrella luteorostrata]|uniref:Major facilitator superfamily (MFS) profile domain-containing protein n=1 Tax=Conoideocrella luteorostrata TaxID=1105319 RepID=A0AAJ0CQJ8_9HYPO|nr:hypothetical protein QQS21_007186 [Conoideocrella luteorostrata]